LAEALLKKLRPDLEVESAGVSIAIPISEEVREFLEKESADHYLKKFPESLDTKRLGEYDLIIAMQQRHRGAILARCPECERKIVVWNIEDPYSMEHDEAERVYKQIEAKVQALANSL
jgi:protein-tyrosine-phosphatase